MGLLWLYYGFIEMIMEECCDIDEYIYIPFGYVKTPIENGHRLFVSFPKNSMVIFHTYVNVYQRVVEKDIPHRNCAHFGDGLSLVVLPRVNLHMFT